MKEQKIQLVLKGSNIDKEEIKELIEYCKAIPVKQRKKRHNDFICKFSK